jgi:molybdopterin molybdotransferase
MTEFLKLRTAEEAWAVFLNNFKPVVRGEGCRVADGLDRTLAEDVRAPHDLPAFVRSTVDGYAMRAADTFGATAGMPAYLDVIGEAPMGALTKISVDVGQAVLVHTGGMVPAGADAVVMLEYTNRAGGPLLGAAGQVASGGGFPAFSIEVSRPVAGGENCIQIGEDVRAGQLILEAGRILRPQDLGALLAVGIVEIVAARQPRVAILSQGDEVVAPEQEPGPGQVRDINTYTLSALVRRAGGIPLTYPIAPDRQEALDALARAAFEQADVVVLTAGSSVSYRDLTANTISGLGKPGVLVHGVAVRPGKPTILALCDGKPVFGLPGNPVSCINIFQLFVTPAIRLLLGARPRRPHILQARLARNVPAAAGRADFVRVKLEERDGEIWAVPVFGKSNLINILVRSEGTFPVPLDSNGIPAGTVVTITLD